MLTCLRVCVSRRKRKVVTPKWRLLSRYRGLNDDHVHPFVGLAKCSSRDRLVINLMLLAAAQIVLDI
jgi:hypothetical protein